MDPKTNGTNNDVEIHNKHQNRDIEHKSNISLHSFVEKMNGF
jgi:hypothetical protein